MSASTVCLVEMRSMRRGDLIAFAHGHLFHLALLFHLSSAEIFPGGFESKHLEMYHSQLHIP